MNTENIENGKPEYLSLKPDNIPQELKQIDQWVCWQAKKGDGKWTKVPYSPSKGSKAKVNDPSTWTDFQTALQAYKAGGYDGIGFVLTEADPFVGVDIDHCVDDDEINTGVKAMIAQLNSYAEISPSGTGVRIFVKGQLPPGWRKKGDFEFYESGRYLTLTGHLVSSNSIGIEERPDALIAVYRNIENLVGDRDMLRKAFAADNSGKTKKLFQGQWKGLFPSQSEADGALCFYLAKWFSDAESLDRIFRRSKLLRNKWDKKHFSTGETYGQRIISEALKKVKQAPNQPQVITAAELLKKELPAPNWMIEGLITTGVTILAGKPKVGKSILVFNIALAVAMGGKALGSIPVNQGDVVYMALEDTLIRLQERLGQMMHYGNDAPDNLYIYTDAMRMGEGLKEFLKKLIHENPKISMIIIDTFALIKPQEKGRGSKNIYDFDYQNIGDLKAIADDNNIAIVLVHHRRKMEADDVMDTFSGTFGLTGAADNLLALHKKKDSQMVLTVTGRDIESHEYSIKFDPHILSWIIEGNIKHIQSTEAMQKIFDAIKNSEKAIGPKKISELTGLKNSYVRNTLKKLIKKGKIEKTGRGQYELPFEEVQF